MTEYLMLDWIEFVLEPYVSSQSESKSTLIIDDFSSHKTELVKNELSSLEVAQKIIPPQMNHYHQPLDVLIMSVCEAAMRDEYKKWKSIIPAVNTSRGNRKSPSNLAIIQFISSSLEKSSQEPLRKVPESVEFLHQKKFQFKSMIIYSNHFIKLMMKILIIIWVQILR